MRFVRIPSFQLFSFAFCSSSVSSLLDRHGQSVTNRALVSTLLCPNNSRPQHWDMPPPPARRLKRKSLGTSTLHNRSNSNNRNNTRSGSKSSLNRSLSASPYSSKRLSLPTPSAMFSSRAKQLQRAQSFMAPVSRTNSSRARHSSRSPLRQVMDGTTTPTNTVATTPISFIPSFHKVATSSSSCGGGDRNGQMRRDGYHHHHHDAGVVNDGGLPNDDIDFSFPGDDDDDDNNDDRMEYSRERTGLNNHNHNSNTTRNNNNNRMDKTHSSPLRHDSSSPHSRLSSPVRTTKKTRTGALLKRLQRLRQETNGTATRLKSMKRASSSTIRRDPHTVANHYMVVSVIGPFHPSRDKPTLCAVLCFVQDMVSANKVTRVQKWAWVLYNNANYNVMMSLARRVAAGAERRQEQVRIYDPVWVQTEASVPTIVCTELQEECVE